MDGTMIGSTLQNIGSYLASQGYKTLIQQAEEPLILEQLLVDLGMHQEQSYILRIAEVPSGGELSGEAVEDEPSPPFKFFQFLVLFPEQAQEGALEELSRFILSLNSNLDMACFGLIESERAIFYRYVYITPIPNVDSEIIITIVNSIEMLLELFVASINDIAQGRKTHKQLQKEAEQAFQNAEFDLWNENVSK